MIHKVGSILLLVAASVACSNPTNELDTLESVDFNSLSFQTGYVYENQFIHLTDEDISNFWIYHFELKSKVENIRIESCDDPSFLILRGETSFAGTSHQLISYLRIEGERLILDPSTCECKTVECHTAGCSPRSSGPGDCNCSPCTGECKKTSVIADLNPSMFL